MQEPDAWKQADEFFKQAIQVRSVAVGEAREFLSRGLKLSEESGYEAGIAQGFTVEGFIFETEGNFQEALLAFQTSYDLYAACLPPYDRFTQKTATHLAKIYANLGDFAKGLNYLYNELRKAETLGDISSMGNISNSVSILYQRMGNQEQAEIYARRCLEFSRQLNDDRLTGISQINMGNVFGQAKDWDSAITHWEVALSVFEKMEDRELVASTQGNLGIAYKNIGQFEIAEKMLLDCLAMKKKNKSQYDIVRSYQNLAGLYTDMKDYAKALAFTEEGIALNAQLQTRSLDYQLWLEKAKALKGLELYRESLEAFEKYHELEKEVFTQESKKQAERLEVQFEIDKKEKEKEIYRLRNIDLVAANEQITLQKEEIESSIRYARRIQEALLPRENVFRQYFPDAFIFYKPRDIVSGDFYWVGKTEDQLFIAVADCTGHGVPGALLSVIGNNLFEQAVHKKKITDPAQILNEVSREMQDLFGRDGDEGSINDGMDVALCRISADKKELVFAGANNAAYIVRDGVLLELDPDRQPIGAHGGNIKPFTARHTHLQTGDCIYIGTDGFSDQFGGPKSKKFQSRQVQEMLVAIASMQMHQQQIHVSKVFHDWKGDTEQTDDVCIIGVRI